MKTKQMNALIPSDKPQTMEGLDLRKTEHAVMETEVDTFIAAFKSEAEQLVRETFPKKMLEIDELFKQLKMWKPSDVDQTMEIPYPEPVDNVGTDTQHNPSEPHSSGKGRIKGHLTGTRVLVFPGGKVSCNKCVHMYCEKVKPLICGLMEHANMVKMWINFLIPKIEDGNNFGVSIQEDVVSEVRCVEHEVSTYLDQISVYYQKRGNIISKISKYPHIDDYRQLIKEMDEHAMVKLQNAVLEMRNHYASLFDIIMKNIDKIKMPRSLSSQNMY
ncbi:unnamed protein product [Candidula unifasciata]|uniref:Proteasome activator complex subunit 3 n=1 Tax=Candidula unifasciata TaxID=100452 RepID=A0A8S4A3X2_9EUPU|nr:unnamed protein product [Candidula unifasciata]